MWQQSVGWPLCPEGEGWRGGQERREDGKGDKIEDEKGRCGGEARRGGEMRRVGWRWDEVWHGGKV